MTKSFSVLRIKSKGEFDWLIEHLRTETHRAHDHWNLWRSLDGAFYEYWEEFNQSPQFWSMSRRALQDSVISRLGRLYDPTKGALSLGNFIETIRHSASSSPTNFFGFDASAIDTNQMMQELIEVSGSDPTVLRLLILRNQYLAHRDARVVGSGSFSSLPELSPIEIDGLVVKASQLMNQYCSLFARPIVSSRLPGADDYRHLLESVRSTIVRLKEVYSTTENA